MSSDYILAYGTHASPQDGRCAMEWVSYLAGEPHSDQPTCVSPVLRAMCIALNDGLDQEPRQRLRPYLTRTIGTAEDDLDTWRGWLAMDWLTRTYTPAWLRLAGLTEVAQRLQDAAAVTGPGPLGDALELLEAARREAHEGARNRPEERLQRVELDVLGVAALDEIDEQRREEPGHDRAAVRDEDGNVVGRGGTARLAGIGSR